MKRIRYALDIAVTWLFFFIALERLLPRQPGAGGGARRAAAPRRRGKRGAGRAGPGAALPGQSALPVQHAEFAVVAGDDRAHRPRRDHAAGAVDLLPDQPVARSQRRRHAWPRRSTSSGSISTSRWRASPTGCTVEIDVPPELEQARLPALLLQPIVENAIKYGVSKSRKAVLDPDRGAPPRRPSHGARDQQSPEARRQGRTSGRHPRRHRASASPTSASGSKRAGAAGPAAATAR